MDHPTSPYSFEPFTLSWTTKAINDSRRLTSHARTSMAQSQSMVDYARALLAESHRLLDGPWRN